jgi:hypothetical protein
MLQIKPLPTRASQIEVPPVMDEVNLKHPFSLAVIAQTGAGKTVAILNLLTNKYMYGNYFDEIYLFSVTGKSDDSFNALRLRKKNIITEKMVPKLKELLDKQQKVVESQGIHKAKKVCIIFEDLTANKKLMNSPDFLKSFVQNRHLSISTIAACHKYHALVRTARLNSNHLWIFACTQSEVKRIIDECCPPQLSAKEFADLISYAFTPDEQTPRPFLWINLKEQSQTRFRKSLNEILLLK